MADAGPLQKAIEEARETAREQLRAAWRIEIERIQEQLEFTWRGHLERIFEERFADLTDAVGRQFRSAVAESNARLRREISGRLNEAVRRIRSFEGEEQWSKAFVGATEGFCARAALFLVKGDALRLGASRGIASDVKIDNTPIASAPAFRGAVESRDTIVALRTRGELSGPISELLGEQPDKRFYLFPIPARDRVAAVLYADSANNGDIDPSALELMATAASAVLESQVSGSAGLNLVRIATAETPQPSISSWFSLSKQEQELHLRAQRFARVHVAEMLLFHAQAVKNGRLNRNLYVSLRDEIDRAREGFRKDFLSASPTMVDYLHLEVVRTLANDDEELLGPEYPGPMV